MALERDRIVAALKRTSWNVGEAARDLGCSRRTLQNRMKALRIPRGTAGRRHQPLPYGRRSKRYSRPALYALGAVAAAGLGYLALHKGSST